MGATPSVVLVKPEVGLSVMEYAVGEGGAGLIANEVMPVVSVGRKTGTYGVLPREAFTQVPETSRRPGTSYNQLDWEFEDASYKCEDHGLKEAIDDELAKTYASYFNYEEAVGIHLANALLLAREKRVAALALGAGVQTQAVTNGAWTTVATSTPKADVAAAADKIRVATGMVPDTIALDWKGWLALLNTTEVKTAVQYTTPITVMPFEQAKALIASYLNVQRVLVSTKIKNSASKNKAFVSAALWDETQALLFKAGSSSIGLKQPCFGLQLLWREDSPTDMVVEQYRDEDVRSDMLRVRHNLDEVLVSAELGCRITGVR